ncbi:MAG: LysM peptidoglycan-binding domain-containing protein [Verrucomicrobiota bacterium]
MTAIPPRRFISLATSLLCLSLGACKSAKPKSGYSDVVDYTTPNTNLSQSEYPFDEQGNYLADVVSGKKKGSKNKRAAAPQSYTETYEKPPETTVASTPNYETPPAATSNPYAPVYSSGESGSGSTASNSKPKSTSSSSSASSKPKSTTASKPKPKPKPAAKPKPKSSTVSYTVKKGDTLYGLANRYGTSVSAIKKANGLSSDMLRDGRSLKIPRK